MYTNFQIMLAASDSNVFCKFRIISEILPAYLMFKCTDQTISSQCRLVWLCPEAQPECVREHKSGSCADEESPGIVFPPNFPVFAPDPKVHPLLSTHPHYFFSHPKTDLGASYAFPHNLLVRSFIPHYLFLQPRHPHNFPSL